MSDFWRTRSFRFWLTFGLVLAIVPMAMSAGLGHFLVTRGVIGAFADVASRQRHELLPAQQLRALMFDASVPVDQFVDTGNAADPAAYRSVRERVAMAFADLTARLQDDSEASDLVRRAREDWVAADRLATEILSVRRAPGDPGQAELMERFDGLLAATADRLAAVSTDVERHLAADHDEALRDAERADWIMGIAAATSVLCIVVAVVAIGQVVSTSVDRLVVGAQRFAAGDHQHRIDVPVPPELHTVADAFNRMIVRIHESEAVLADLARRDGLTKLLNRRAFDDALAEAFARLDRAGGTVALVMMDIDHFKRINDTYGHGIGDDVLKAVASVLTADVRLVDRVFRVGGEEFGVLLFDAEAESARTTAERLRQAVATSPVQTPRGDVRVTISAGLAVAAAGDDRAAFVAAADQALYRAKQGGRNQVAV